LDRAEVAVVGAGVVGLAVARALAREGREVLLLEAARACGTGASSRNSEVIHAGLYYPAASLKARLCVEGRLRLYDYCARRGIAHRRCGKLIVAASADEVPELERIAAAARANGVEIHGLDASGAAALEPQLRCASALLSPQTGIVDTHGYLMALLADAERSGATCAYSTRVTYMRLDPDGVSIAVNGGPPSLHASLVVNSAGLDAPALARATEGLDPTLIPPSRLAKGSYFALAGRAPFTRLIYPAPPADGLGIHLTLDLAGRARFGPDVEWIEAPDYEVDARRAPSFYAAIRRYWPALPDGALRPAYAGVRPKLCGPGDPAADFRIDGPDALAAPLVNLFGIESPGLTASLAIAEEVVQRLRAL
jgi:L-2-hydroxyglutarate oxidase LhgO